MPWRLPWPRRQRTDALWAWGTGCVAFVGQTDPPEDTTVMWAKTPNKGIELTASSVRSCVAPASSRA
jgi:hypothetical protein